MPQMNEGEYTAEKYRRNNAAYRQLQRIIKTNAPDAAKFRRALKKALAAGFPVNYTPSDVAGWTLLHVAAFYTAGIRAGLPQILMDAGAAPDTKTDDGWIPADIAGFLYVKDGAPEHLAAINVFLAKGARPELDEEWNNGWRWPSPDQRTRRDWLIAYITTWAERGVAAARGGEGSPVFDYAL